VPPDYADVITGDHNLVLERHEGVNVAYITMNIERYPLDQPDFRRALNMLINRENIINKIYSGQAVQCRGLLPPVIGGNMEREPRAKYDPEEAKKIIEKYQVEEGRVFKLVGLPFLRSYCPDPNQMARLIAGYMKGVGLKLEYLPTYSMEDYFEKIADTEFDFIVDGYVIDSPSRDDFYTYVFGVGVDYPYEIRWKSEEFDSLVCKARSITDDKEREKVYARAEDLFFSEYPWIILVHSNELAAYRKDVEGLVIIPTGEIRLGKARKI
jgi:dipeptide transport system substrate-binding protein